MDSLITAAARALATGDPLGALKRVALRNDAPALALRGIAMAQLGDLVRAKALLRRAARAFGPKEEVARARCIVAEAEIALVSRDLSFSAKSLDTAQAALEGHGDRPNAAHARHLKVQRLLLIGRLDEAERALAKFDAAPLPPALRAAHELVVAGVAMRRLRIKAARAALIEAERAARHAGIPALMAEVESTALVLNTPAARLIAPGEERPLLLEEVEALLASGALVGADGFAGWSAAKVALDKRLKEILPRMPKWTLHDLRRTVSTQMHEKGVAPHVVEAIINHISGHKAGVAGRYNHANYSSERKAALDMWAAHVMSLVSKRPFVVVAKAA